MSFVLETDVAMPGRRNRYPFDQMAPGQSFEIVGQEESRKVRNAAYQYAKKVNTETKAEKGTEGFVAFALRKTGETDATPASADHPAVEAVKIYRLWRE